MCKGQDEAEDWRRSCHPFSVGECDAAAEMQNELAPCQGGHSPIQEVPTNVASTRPAKGGEEAKDAVQCTAFGCALLSPSKRYEIVPLVSLMR